MHDLAQYVLYFPKSGPLCMCGCASLSNCTHLSVCYETQISHVLHLIFLGTWKKYEYGLFWITTLSCNQCSVVDECQNPGSIYANTGLQEKKKNLENCLKSVFMSLPKSGDSVVLCMLQT